MVWPFMKDRNKKTVAELPSPVSVAPVEEPQASGKATAPVVEVRLPREDVVVEGIAGLSEVAEDLVVALTELSPQYEEASAERERLSARIAKLQKDSELFGTLSLSAQMQLQAPVEADPFRSFGSPVEESLASLAQRNLDEWSGKIRANEKEIHRLSLDLEPLERVVSIFENLANARELLDNAITPVDHQVALEKADRAVREARRYRSDLEDQAFAERETYNR